MGVCLVSEILIYRGVGGIAKCSAKGTGTSSARKTAQCAVFSEMGPAGPKEQGTGMAAAANTSKSFVL